MYKVSARCYSFLLGAALVFGIPSTALAQTSLTWAKVERLRNRVHLIPSNRGARLARVTDVMSVGDALRTASSARAELRFNDGSLARVGEQATFRFSPNTRNFQLSNGTVLLLIPPGRGRTTIQTPNAVTGIQGSALFVRVRCLAELTAEGHCSSPVTLVGALTNNPAGAMVAYNENGSQQQPIYAGEMVVIEGETITQRHEFDLRTFYQTSGLVEGLELDSSTPPESLSNDLQGVWQEIQDALELQGDFDDSGEEGEIVENPEFIAPVISSVSDDEREPSGSLFAGFPNFASSLAAIFHGVGEQVATSETVLYTESPANPSVEDGSVTAVTGALFREAMNEDTEPTAGSPSPSVVLQPAVSAGAELPTAEIRVAPSAASPVVSSAPAAAPVVDPILPSVGTESSLVVEPTATVPIDNVPSTVVPQTSSIPEVAPETVIESTPVVTAPEIAPEPVSDIAPTVDIAPVVEQTPTVEQTPVIVVQPEPSPVVDQSIVPSIEADEGPRSPETEGAFDWDKQQPEGASNPDVVSPSLDIPVN